MVSQFDIRICLYAALWLFSYFKGYRLYLSGQPVYATAYALIFAMSLLAFFRRFRYLKYLHMRLKKIDKLSGRGFEQYLAAQFKHQGWRVELTEKSHDYGADLILRKRGKCTVVQVKRYDKNVGISAIQEAVGAIAYYEADQAMVVTNSSFTKNARNLAGQNGVELWDREEIRRRFGIRE